MRWNTKVAGRKYSWQDSKSSDSTFFEAGRKKVPFPSFQDNATLMY